MRTLRCACGWSIAAFLAADVAQRGLGREHRALVVGLAGFPFTGKTSLARDLVAFWAPHPAVVLPTEAAIVSRDLRRSRGVDGCSADAYDLNRLDSLVRDLSHNCDVTMDVYSWRAGRHTRLLRLRGLPSSGLLVVDGSVSCEHPVATRCDVVVFLCPSDPLSWVDQAARRDVRQRAWSAEAARFENLSKRATVEEQYRRQQGSITDVVVVDTAPQVTTWKARIAGCRPCLLETRKQRASSAREASVSNIAGLLGY